MEYTKSDTYDLINFNNEKYLTANYFGFDTSDFNTETQSNFAKYDLIMLSMNGWHGLRQHQRQFYVDNISKTIYPIYKDGNLNFISPDKTFSLWLDNYHLNALTLQDQLFIDYPFDCISLLDETDRKRILGDTVFNPECIAGYWDGDNNLHERVINSFINIYNSNNKIK